MAELTILTEKELMERYKLRRHFVRQHRRDLGAIGKRNFVYDQELVEMKLRDMAWAHERRRTEQERAAAKLAADMQKAIERSRVPQIGEGRIITGMSR